MSKLAKGQNGKVSNESSKKRKQEKSKSEINQFLDGVNDLSEHLDEIDKIPYNDLMKSLEEDDEEMIYDDRYEKGSIDTLPKGEKKNFEKVFNGFLSENSPFHLKNTMLNKGVKINKSQKTDDPNHSHTTYQLSNKMSLEVEKIINRFKTNKNTVIHPTSLLPERLRMDYNLNQKVMDFSGWYIDFCDTNEIKKVHNLIDMIFKLEHHFEINSIEMFTKNKNYVFVTLRITERSYIWLGILFEVVESEIPEDVLKKTSVYINILPKTSAEKKAYFEDIKVKWKTYFAFVCEHIEDEMK